MEYQQIDVTKDPSAVDVVTSLGYTSAPVTVVDLGDGASWTWTGYAPSQLERLASLIQ